MSPRSRRLATVCLIAGLALAVAGQYYFARRREYPWDAVFLYALASVLFLAAVRLAGLASTASPDAEASPWRLVLGWLRRHHWRAALATLGALAVITVGARAASPLTAAQGYALLGLWAAGVLVYLAAAADWQGALAWWRSVAARVAANRWEALAVLGLTAVAAVARLAALDHVPYILGGDEASMGREALNVLSGRLTNPFATGWFSHPTLYFYVLAASLRWPGGAVTGLRVVPALAGVLTVPALYLLGRELFGRRVALLAAGYLACYHYAIHYSRLALNNSLDPLLAALIFYSLLVGVRSRRPAPFALAGVLMGLAQYFYMGSRVVVIIAAGFLAWMAWSEAGFWRTHRGHLAVMAGGFLLAGWPLFLFFARHPEDFSARITQLGILQSGWLASEAIKLQRSQLSLLWQQFARTVLAFHYYPDPAPFYHPGVPLLDPVSAVLFTFGLVYTMASLRRRGHALMALWFWCVLLFGGVLLENPPSSQRLLLSVVPVSLFVAWGLSLTAEVARRAARWRPASTWAVLGLAVILLGGLSLRFYFGPYTRARVYPGLNTEVGHRMGLYLSELGPEYHYLFFGAPRMYAGFPSLVYLAPEVDGEDVLELPPSPAEWELPSKRLVFLFLPERLAELEAVKQWYPGGELREFRQPSGLLLFAAYVPGEVPVEPQ
ncbi:MAG: glycosyltransferase family 39 protein [Anaerolineae bacterium]|nr:glycosyltransferase family 39 protein [Anaerolineae bacterium]